MQGLKIFASAIGACAVVLTTAGTAQSDARICRQLQHEANELRQAGSGAHRASLTRELRKAERDVQRAGCKGLRLIFGGNRNCGTLRSNMNRLRRQVANAGSTRSPQRRLQAVEAQMRQHGCTGGTRQASAQSGDRYQRNSKSFQTVCVRECDGYYFPIGYATPKGELERDQAVCQAFYPEGAADLYIHRSGSDKDETAMVSLEGEAYADKPFAFAYRSAYQPACATLLRDGVKPEKPAEKGETIVAVDLSTAIPIPVPRPALVDEARVASQNAEVDIVPDADKKDVADIRVVGPATPYLVGKPADGSVAPVASAPQRIERPETSWLEQISSLIAPAAQADESSK